MQAQVLHRPQPLQRARHAARRPCFKSCSTSSSVGTVPVEQAAQQPLHISYTNLQVDTRHPGISCHDITPLIREQVTQSGVQEGWVNVLSRHTTTALTINENETRLLDDIRQWLHKLAPPSAPYLHNDLHLREAPTDWPGGHAAWVQQEPINAHSHLLSMMLGNTLTVPITKGKLALGTWQSVMLVELDGPRPRTVGLQVVGHTASSTPGPQAN